jgi:superfamily II DNA or RNA helicase
MAILTKGLQKENTGEFQELYSDIFEKPDIQQWPGQEMSAAEIYSSPSPRNKIDQLLKAYQTAATPQQNPEELIQNNLEQIALNQPDVYDDYSKGRKEGLSHAAALSVAESRKRPGEEMFGGGKSSGHGAGGGYGDDIGTPLAKGINRLLQMPGDMARMIPSVVALLATQSVPGTILPDIPSQVGPKVFEKVKPFADKLAEQVEKVANKISPYEEASGKYAEPAKKISEYFTDPIRAYKTIAENGPQMLGFIGSTLINPIFGMAVMASAEGGEASKTIDNYEKATGEKVDPNVKILTPIVVGSINAALEKAGIDQILKVAKIPGLAGKITQSIIANLTEGTQEGLQEVVQILGEKGYKKEAKTFKQELPRIIESVYGGMLIGTAGAIGSGTAGYLSDIEVKEGIKKVEQKIPPIPEEKIGQPEIVSTEELPEPKMTLAPAPMQELPALEAPKQEGPIQNIDDQITSLEKDIQDAKGLSPALNNILNDKLIALKNEQAATKEKKIEEITPSALELSSEKSKQELPEQAITPAPKEMQELPLEAQQEKEAPAEPDRVQGFLDAEKSRLESIKSKEPDEADVIDEELKILTEKPLEYISQERQRIAEFSAENPELGKRFQDKLKLMQEVENAIRLRDNENAIYEGGLQGEKAKRAGSQNIGGENLEQPAPGQSGISGVRQEGETVEKAGVVPVKEENYFRGDGKGSMPKGLTALDVLKYENEELGNADIKAKVSDDDLKNIKSENLVWLTTTEEAAKEYGDITKENVGLHRIVAEDGYGGILIEVTPKKPNLPTKEESTQEPVPVQKPETITTETKPPKKLEKPVAKELWEMTQDEYISKRGDQQIGNLVARSTAEIGAKKRGKDYYAKKVKDVERNTVGGIRTPERWAIMRKVPEKERIAHHREWIDAAIKAGKQVPPEVLAEYPDLQPQQKAPEQPTPEIQSVPEKKLEKPKRLKGERQGKRIGGGQIIGVGQPEMKTGEYIPPSIERDGDLFVIRPNDAKNIEPQWFKTLDEAKKAIDEIEIEPKSLVKPLLRSEQEPSEKLEPIGKKKLIKPAEGREGMGVLQGKERPAQQWKLLEEKAFKEEIEKPQEVIKQPIPKDIFLSGKTYDIKEKIKAIGGRWQPDRSGWLVPSVNAEKARQFADRYNLNIKEQEVPKKETEIKKVVRNGRIYLYFPDIPAINIRAALKDVGYQWDGTNKAWVATENEKTHKIADKVYEKDKNKESISTVGTQPGTTGMPGFRRAESKNEKIIISRQEVTPEPDRSRISEGITQHLEDHQIQGVGAAINAMESGGGFILADGTGVGKTREELAVAKYYSAKGSKVIIITKSEVIKPNWQKKKYSSSFLNDSDAMGIEVNLTRGKEDKFDDGKIYLSTYENLKNIRNHIDMDTIIIFDEAHALKNRTSIRSKEGTAIANRAKAVLYATATPADKPTHLDYMSRAGVFEGKRYEQQYRDLGLTTKSVHIGGGRTIETWIINPQIGAKEVFKRISGLFNRLSAKGQMIKREISMAGMNVNFTRIVLPAEAQQVMADIENTKFSDNDGLDKALKLMHQRRQQEPFKIQATVEMAKKDLAEGRQVVIFASRVNKSEVKGKYSDTLIAESEGTLKQLKDELIRIGLKETDIAELHGAAKEKPDQAMKAFQAGDKKVMIATMESGGTGVNLDDTIGDKPRSMIIMTAPFGAMDNVQAVGRVLRLKTKSKPQIRYIFANTEVDRWNSAIIGAKMKMLHATISGEVEKLDISELETEATEEFQAQLIYQTETPEFKRWFGDWEKEPEKASKVVDETGKTETFLGYEEGESGKRLAYTQDDKGYRHKLNPNEIQPAKPSGIQFAPKELQNKKLQQVEPPVKKKELVRPEKKKKRAKEPNQKSDIQDFGQKIGGARKDIWQSITKEIPDEDIAKLSLSEIWPKSDVNAIEDLSKAAIATAVRNEIPSKPRVPYKLRRWVENVKIVRTLMTAVENRGADDVLNKMSEFSPGLAKLVDKINILKNIPREHWGRIGRVENRPNAYSYDNEGKQVSKPFAYIEIDGKHVSGKDINDITVKALKILGGEKPTSKMTFEIRRRGKDYFINKQGDHLYRSLKDFDNLDDAKKYLRENNSDLIKAWDELKERENVKETDVRRKENRPRTGADYRKGKDVTPEMFMDAFGFRGVEFGNWVSQGKNFQERQGMLNAAFDALSDLAGILNIPTRVISINGTLGLGLGSRGTGWASAHYEPETLVINLTKTRGAGSLAHEWFHALDNYFQRKREPGQKVVKEPYITYQPETYYRHKDGTKLSQTRYNEISSRSGIRNQNDWTRVEGVRPEVEEAFSEFVKVLNDSPMRKRAELIDKGQTGGYWGKIIERAARSFENYIIAKMQQNGYSNDYLANVVSVKEWSRDPNRYPYLLAEELKPVEKAFDNLFSTIETKETEQGTEFFQLLTNELDQSAQHIDQTKTPEFKRWFGDWEKEPEKASKVVDAEGKPLVVYHGTPNAGFGDFPAYFSENKNIAEIYTSSSASSLTPSKKETGKGVYPVFLNIRKPFDTRISRIREIWKNEFEGQGGENWADMYQTGLSNRGLPDWTNANDIYEFIQEKGYDFDGIVLDEGGLIGLDRGISYLAFGSTQIKSAIGNRGSFSPENPNILEQRLTDDQFKASEKWNKDATEILSKAIQGVTVRADQASFDFMIKRSVKAKQMGVENRVAGIYYAPENVIYLNPRIARQDTIFHEFAHPYINYMRKNNPKLYQQGIELIKGTHYEKLAQVAGYKNASDEALVIAIGENGERIQDQTKRNAFRAWVKRVLFHVNMTFRKAFGKVFPGKFQITLSDFVNAATYQMRGGRKVFDVREGALGKSQRQFEGFSQFQLLSKTDQEVFEKLSPLKAKSGADNKIDFMSYLINEGYSLKFVQQAGKNYEAIEDVPVESETPAIELPPETIFQFVQRKIHDKYNRSTLFVRKAEELKGDKITDPLNFRQEMELFIGRASDQINEQEKKLTNGKDGFLERLTNAGHTLDDIGDYLYARHAQERNAFIRENRDPENDAGAGITDEQAETILEKYKDSGIEEYADEFYNLVTKSALKLMYESGLLTEEEYSGMTEQYKYYVPLKNNPDNKAFRFRGQGYSVPFKGIIRAEGRGEGNIADNPFIQSIMDYEDAIIRSEKNKVGQSFLEFIKANPNLKIYSVQGRRKMPEYNSYGELVSIQNVQQRLDDNQLAAWVDGKQKVITIYDEPLARGLKNLGSEKGIALLNGLNTWLRAVNTYLNPEFFITNFERDLQTALINLSAEDTNKLIRKVAKDIPGAIRGIFRVERDKDSNWAEIYKKYKSEGGKTGWYDHMSLEEKSKKFEKAIKFYQHPNKAKQAVKATFDFIGDINDAIENAVRLSAFKNAIENGTTPKQAANLAKNLTINFNKKGELGAIMNSLYLFSNVGIQGGARLLVALKSPRVRKIVAGLAAFSFFLNMLNRWIDNDEYEKIDEYIRDTNYILMLPNHKFIMIKLPYGYNVFNAIGNAAADGMLAMRKGDGKDRIVAGQSIRVINAIVDAFNPFGTSGSAGQFISPTAFDPIVQLLENKNFFGGPIRKEQPAYSPKKPSSQLTFDSVNPAIKAVTDWLHKVSGGTEQKSGLIEINSEDIEHIISFVTGGIGRMFSNAVTTGIFIGKEHKLPELNKIPFVRKAVGETSEWMEMQYIHKMLDESARTQFTESEREQYKNAVLSAFKNNKIDEAYRNRLLATFSNGQKKIDYAEKGKSGEPELAGKKKLKKPVKRQLAPPLKQ